MSRETINTAAEYRSYLGEATFRGAVHQSSPEPFVDPILFAQAEALLAE